VKSRAGGGRWWREERATAARERRRERAVDTRIRPEPCILLNDNAGGYVAMCGGGCRCVELWVGRCVSRGLRGLFAWVATRGEDVD
jgi:hypothetical protein